MVLLVSRYRYQIVCCETESVQEHAAILEANSNEGWELVVVYEGSEDWRFVFRKPDDNFLS
jgi:hypothetical protein